MKPSSYRFLIFILFFLFFTATLLQPDSKECGLRTSHTCGVNEDVMFSSQHGKTLAQGVDTIHTWAVLKEAPPLNFHASGTHKTKSESPVPSILTWGPCNATSLIRTL